MRYITILRSPFKYDSDIEKMSILQAFITLGISFIIFILTNILSIDILINKFMSEIDRSSLGTSSYMGSGMSYVYGIVNPIKGKMLSTILYSCISGSLIAVFGAILVVFLIRRRKDEDYRFINATSFVATSLVIPIAITPIVLLGFLLFNNVGIYIICTTILASLVIFVINIIEGFNVINKDGKGNIIYFTAIITSVYYFLSIYVSIRVFLSVILSYMRSMF